MSVVRVDTSRTLSGQLRLSVVFSNTSGRELWTEVLTDFVDTDGRVLEPAAYWEPLRLPEDDVTVYAVRSAHPEAVDFSMVVRESKLSGW